MSKMLVWEIQIAKEGKKKPFKKLHILAEFFLQAAHMAADEVYGGDEEDSMFDFSVDIVGINRVGKIKDLINAHSIDDEEMHHRHEISPDEPYILFNNPNFPAEQKISFKCSCANIQEIALFNFNEMKCRDCGRIIKRSEIQNISGIWCLK